MHTTVKFAKVRPTAKIPTKRDEDAGYDIYANFEEDYKQFVLLSIQKNFNIDFDNKNYAYLKSLKPQELYFRYLADSKRIPPAIPRKVHISKELLAFFDLTNLFDTSKVYNTIFL